MDDDDAIGAVPGQVWVAAGVLRSRYGLDEPSSYALIAEEWTARDLPLGVVIRQLLDEAVRGVGHPARERDEVPHGGDDRRG
ncbi:hypothetical protein [Actinomycetospora sp. TBRC 11914]|uniref:hypothetical protein n=1 Tax=Actinomycetospora sp. TBRC 11914 TaxID=2729387 RepID=UPI00145F2D2D|nr:hypothetical protein [Actinomycetospora sp. TBRC 11914]NMO94082.1 hypothetical protein [Actinomycetospora sp. TBRC 11914]